MQNWIQINFEFLGKTKERQRKENKGIRKSNLSKAHKRNSQLDLNIYEMRSKSAQSTLVREGPVVLRKCTKPCKAIGPPKNDNL